MVATATQADLIVTNSASPTSLAAGSNVTYTQSITNNGPAAATTVSFTADHAAEYELPVDFCSLPGGRALRQPWVEREPSPAPLRLSPSGSANTANFTLVLQVNAGTPSGTNITETDTATASNIVPSLTTNTASASVLVANANSADMAIVKTATPNPVTEGTPLTYSLAVTNNGPASRHKRYRDRLRCLRP